MAVRLVLASGSPRRRDFLTNARLDFAVVPADIDESVVGGESPIEYVRRLAAEKAAVVRDSMSAGGSEQIVVLAADTTIDHDGVILAKPVDDHDVRAMLRRLSGSTHHCHTGIAVAQLLNRST